METDLDRLEAEEGVSFADGDSDLEGFGVIGGLAEPGEAMDAHAIAGEDGARAGARAVLYRTARRQNQLRRMRDDCIHQSVGVQKRRR